MDSGIDDVVDVDTGMGHVLSKRWLSLLGKGMLLCDLNLQFSGGGVPWHQFVSMVAVIFQLKFSLFSVSPLHFPRNSDEHCPLFSKQ